MDLRLNLHLNVEKYTPVFVGKTDDDEKIVIYRKNNIYHIRLSNGKLHALGPGSVIETHRDHSNDITRVHISSAVWSGEMVGTRAELIEEPALLQPLPVEES